MKKNDIDDNWEKIKCTVRNSNVDEKESEFSNASGLKDNFNNYSLGKWKKTGT